MDDARLHWTETDFTCLARAWLIASVKTVGRTKGFTFYQNVNIAFNKDPECPTQRSSGLTKAQWYTLNAQCVAYKRIIAQERFRHDSGKIKEDRVGSRPIGQELFRNNLATQKELNSVVASGSDIQTILDELRLKKRQANEEKEIRRAEANQQWQAKINLEQAREDRKIIKKDLSNLSGHQLQYYLQKQAEVLERLTKRGGLGCPEELPGLSSRATFQICQGRRVLQQDAMHFRGHDARKHRPYTYQKAWDIIQKEGQTPELNE
ncbi:hypothetical protein GIB67_011347, partial [Kingdonia uniflora]